jgi:hypothetical protein
VKCSTALIQGFNFSSKMPMCPQQVSRETTKSSIDLFISGMKHLEDFGCPLPCSVSSYRAELFHQHKNVFEVSSAEPLAEDFVLYYYFSSLDTDVNTETLIIDFPNLVANIGGNLGLFLGFSCLSIYVMFLDMLQKMNILDSFKSIPNRPSRSSKVVEHSLHLPKVEGSHPTTVGPGRGKRITQM